jgi:signal transduction histidine kinase
LPARFVAGLVVVLTTGLVVSQFRLGALASDWPAERENRIEAASRRLGGDLHRELERLVGLTRQAAEAAALPDDDLFHRLERLIPHRGVETGVVVLRADGSPRAWAGRHRLPPSLTGDSLAARFSPWLSVFETRRSLADGGVVVASLLLDADPVVPHAGLSLSERFRQRTEVGLSVYPPDAAPLNRDVFDYEEPTTAGPRVIFSVRPRPPTQGEATLRVGGQGARWVTLTILLLAPAAMLLTRHPAIRYVLLGGLLWMVIRTPAFETLGLGAFASPALYFRELPFGLAAVAGPLLIMGLLLIHLGVALWRRPGPRGVPAFLAGYLLLASAPYLVRALGQGITPPLNGVTIPLWLTWEVTLLLATGGLLVMAAGLLRHTATPRTNLWPMLGAAWGAGAAVAGIFAWEGQSGWPEWYPLLWLPALFLVTRPAARRATILSVAVVAGSAAALVTWGAELEGRVEIARRDLLQLGGAPELLAEPVLRGLAEHLRSGPPPDGAEALFAAWRRSALDRQGYPARLELRSSRGERLTGIELHRLDVPDSLVARVVAGLTTDTIVTLKRTPGLHYLLAQRLTPDTIAVAILGPRSLLVPPAWLGRLVTRPGGRPPYRIMLSAVPPQPDQATDEIRWRREGWTIRGERTVEVGNGPRQAVVAIEMLAPGPLLVRGGLVLVLNVVLLLLVWRLAELMAGERVRPLPARQTLRSFRAQLFVTLALFVVLPVAGFAAWSIVRLNEEARRDRQQVVTQTLRDLLAAEPGFGGEPSATADRLLAIARRDDLELGVYREGRLAASTSPMLASFGVLPPLMDPGAWHRIRLDGEREAVGEGLDASSAGLVGYRAFREAGAEAPAILALPQATDDPALAARQLDLVLALLLASLLGILAALVAAQFAARRLTRPVAELRRAALAFGAGQPMDAPSADPPLEFEPVFAAFTRMADDIRATQEAQERAARVLAWGEMASQVAHEVKNPLTPMRLGIQHLQRVWRERRDRFGEALDETAPRVLAEIDRLDRIARSFSRYGAPAQVVVPLEAVDLGQVLAEVVPLYRVGTGAMDVEVGTAAGAPVLARRDEVKEVLLNLLENAREAGARRVVLRVAGRVLTVEDDGRGMPPEMLERIFEPRFSSTTSGAGLGLAIVRRLVEGWGATITVTSEAGKGSRFVLAFRGSEQGAVSSEQ